MELEEAIKICKILCGKKNKKGKREYGTFKTMQMQLDYTADEIAEAIETVLEELEQEQENNLLSAIREKKLEENSIPKKKIEDKIKELKRLKENPKKAKHYVAWYSRRIQVLQELLEENNEI